MIPSQRRPLSPLIRITVAEPVCREGQGASASLFDGGSLERGSALRNSTALLSARPTRGRRGPGARVGFLVDGHWTPLWTTARRVEDPTGFGAHQRFEPGQSDSSEEGELNRKLSGSLGRSRDISVTEIDVMKVIACEHLVSGVGQGNLTVHQY